MSLTSYIFLKITLTFKNVISLAANNWPLTVLLSIVAFFQPIAIILYFVIFSVAIDLLSGLFKAMKLKQKITSFRLRDTIVKLFLYLTLLMLVYGIEVSCLFGAPITNIIGAFILLAEAVSIAENVDVIVDGKLGLASFIKKLRKKWFNSKIENNK